MNCWVNSNTGDYITFHNNEYVLVLISRYSSTGEFLPYKSVVISELQFKFIKGFIPIKYKKLMTRIHKPGFYSKTDSSGRKSISDRVNIPNMTQIRDNRLKLLGI